MKMYLISDNIDTQTGMRLAGVDGVVVHEREELRTALETALADKEIGILLLTEKFGREFPEIVDEVKLHHKVPLIVEIPDRHGTGRKPDFIAYDHRYADCPGFLIDRMLFRTPAFAWTVKDEHVYNRTRKKFDAAIFEHFHPKDGFQKPMNCFLKNNKAY